jgi:predicted MFS family arabinose efflux permease
LILAGGSVGALLGALLTGRITARFGPGPALMGSAMVLALSVLSLPMAAGPRLMVVLIILGGEFIGGFAVMVFDINCASLKGAITPDHLLGRVSASSRFITCGSRPLGALAGGILGTALGLRPTLAVAAAGSLLAMLWIWFSPLHGLRALPPVSVDAEPAIAS